MAAWATSECQQLQLRTFLFPGGDGVKKVFVAGLPFNVDWQELKRYFRTAGTGAVLHAVAATAA